MEVECACIYRGYCQKHDHELFFPKDRMPDKSIGKPREAPSALFQECRVSRDVVAIDRHPLRGQERQLPERIPFVQAIK